MITKTFYTKDGTTTRELTTDEYNVIFKNDEEVKKDKYKKAKKDTIEERLKALEDLIK